MLQNAYFLAKIGADTAENEQHFAEIGAGRGRGAAAAGAEPAPRRGDRGRHGRRRAGAAARPSSAPFPRSEVNNSEE